MSNLPQSAESAQNDASNGMVQQGPYTSSRSKSLDFLLLLRTYPPIFKDLITLMKCLKLFTERPMKVEMRKLKKNLLKIVNQNSLRFYDRLSILENFMTF